jgi:hypothetical protein
MFPCAAPDAGLIGEPSEAPIVYRGNSGFVKTRDNCLVGFIDNLASAANSPLTLR